MMCAEKNRALWRLPHSFAEKTLVLKDAAERNVSIGELEGREREEKKGEPGVLIRVKEHVSPRVRREWALRKDPQAPVTRAN